MKAMNEINDRYFELLEKGMLDKVWFLEKIEHSVNTLVDFGCGDGSLFVLIDRIYPGRFRYIGIDHNPEMIAAAKENGIEVYSSLAELPEIDYDKSALILNSVLHEIFSYSAFNAAYELFEEMEAKKFRHIAIRDMCLNRKDKLPNYTKEIMDSEFADQFQEFMEINPDTIYPDIADYKVLTLEFLLKYRYEQLYIAQRLDTLVISEQIGRFYQENLQKFVVDRPVVKARALVIPASSKNYKGLRQLMASTEQSEVMDAAKEAATAAIRFLDLADNWTDALALAREMGADYQKLFFRAHSGYNEYTDEGGTAFIAYVLEIVPEGKTAPQEFVTQRVRDLVLSERKHKLESQLERSLLEDARANRKFVIY